MFEGHRSRSLWIVEDLKNEDTTFFKASASQLQEFFYSNSSISHVYLCRKLTDYQLDAEVLQMAWCGEDVVFISLSSGLANLVHIRLVFLPYDNDL